MHYYNIRISFFLLFVIYVVIPSFGQSPFSPSDITGLQLWLRADSAVIVDTNNNVTEWRDVSGNNNHFSQAIPSECPLYVDTGVLKTKSIYFDGTVKQLNNSSLLNGTNFPLNQASVFIVWGLNGIAGSYGVMSTRSVYSGTGYWRWGGDGNGYFQNFRNARIDGFPSNMPDHGCYHSTLITSSNYEFFLNGVSKGTWTADWGYGSDFVIGRDEIGASLNGEIAEVIVYNTALSTIQRQQVDLYIRNKYAPPVNLGADIAVNYGFCPVKINAHKNWFINYIWNTGAITDSIYADSSIAYSVTTTDIFGYTSSDTVKVTFPGNFKPFPDTTICYGNLIKWDTQLNKKGYSFLWKGGSTDSVLTITQAGKYYVKVTDTLGCFRYSDTITVKVDSFPITTSLGPPVIICSGASISLASGSALASSYSWSPGGATTSSIIIIASGTYSVTVQDAKGCSAKDSIHVVVKGVNPVPDFIAPDACFGDSMHFTDISTVILPAHVTRWNWNFGDATLSSLKNPSHSYSVAGTYTATLTVVSDSGCSATIQKAVTVNPKPTALFITSSPKCSGSGLQFTDQSSILNGFLFSWQWNFGDPASGSNTSSVQYPTHIYNASGTYTVQLIVTSDKGCTDTVFRMVNVNLTPTPSFTADTVCQGAGTHFAGISTGLVTNWVWDFGDGNTSSNQNTMNAYASAGAYNVLLTVTSDSGCMNSYTNNVMVYYLPVSNFTGDSVCVNAPLQFIDASSVTGSSISLWNWQFGSMGSSTQQNPVVTFTASGTYSVMLSVTSAQGCSASSVQSVQAMPLPVPSFSFSPQYGSLPLNVSFTDLSSGAFSYLWSFGDGGQSSLANPSHIYQDTGLFHITLVSQTKFGCKDSLTHDLPIDVSILDVANNLVSVIQQSNAVQAYASLYNTGNIDVNSIQLSAYMDDGNPVLETWTGTLTPTNSITYKFNSSFEIISNKKHNMVCVDVLLVNGRADDVLSNNYSCTAITSDFTLLNPFPNPAGDDIYFLFVLPLDGTVNLEIYDVRGRKVEAFEENAFKGLNQVTYHTLKLSRGIYFLKLYYKDAALGKMFMKE